MIRNLVGFISKTLVPTNTTALTAVRPANANPFSAQSTNPFVGNSSMSTSFYGKN